MHPDRKTKPTLGCLNKLTDSLTPSLIADDGLRLAPPIKNQKSKFLTPHHANTFENYLSNISNAEGACPTVLPF